mmetsp:Transcript_60401/g.142501  ORF Transcript_60401/g.142501 Transcript_60401/m.142501 type:complete len:270 (-) Transcript_60401:2080-2889(-)
MEPAFPSDEALLGRFHSSPPLSSQSMEPLPSPSSPASDSVRLGPSRGVETSNPFAWRACLTASWRPAMCPSVELRDRTWAYVCLRASNLSAIWDVVLFLASPPPFPTPFAPAAPFRASSSDLCLSLSLSPSSSRSLSRTGSGDPLSVLPAPPRSLSVGGDFRPDMSLWCMARNRWSASPCSNTSKARAFLCTNSLPSACSHRASSFCRVATTLGYSRTMRLNASWFAAAAFPCLPPAASPLRVDPCRSWAAPSHRRCSMSSLLCSRPRT